MAKEYFKALWRITIVCAFYLFVSYIFKSMEGIYTSLGKKNRMTEDDAKSLSNKEFKKRYKKLFKCIVKKKQNKIKRNYYEMKFCETQMTSLDSLYELDRTFRSNGIYIPSKIDILDSYLDAKKVYESSVDTYQSSVISLSDYLHSVDDILSA